MSRHMLFLLCLSLVLAASAGTVHALRGVIGQTLFIADAKNVQHVAFTLSMSAEAPVDVNDPEDVSEYRTFEQTTSWAIGHSVVDGDANGFMGAEVRVYENLWWNKVGNYEDGTGMQSTRSLSESYDADRVRLTLDPTDNPYGVLKVTLVQKTYLRIRFSYDRNGATDQTKYAYVRTVVTMIDGNAHELIVQWNQSTASSTSDGAGVTLTADGVEVSGSWQKTVDQGVDSFQHVFESRVTASQEIDLACTGPGDTLVHNDRWGDAGFHWDLNIVDQNWGEFLLEGAELRAEAESCTVIGFGRVGVTKNADGTADGCDEDRYAGTDLGNPELVTDRPIVWGVPCIGP